MKIFFYVGFIILNFILLFRINEMFYRNKMLKIYGISFGLNILFFFFFTIFIGLLIKHFLVSSLLIDFYKNDYLLYIFISISAVIIINILCILSSYIIDSLILFHEKNNANNINKNPIRFVVKNKKNILFIVRVLLGLGGFAILFGIWFGKK